MNNYRITWIDATIIDPKEDPDVERTLLNFRYSTPKYTTLKVLDFTKKKPADEGFWYDVEMAIEFRALNDEEAKILAPRIIDRLGRLIDAWDLSRVTYKSIMTEEDVN